MCGDPCAASRQVRGGSALPTLPWAPPGPHLPGTLQNVTLHYYSKGLTSRKRFPCELPAAASCSETAAISFLQLSLHRWFLMWLFQRSTSPAPLCPSARRLLLADSCSRERMDPAWILCTMTC